MVDRIEYHFPRSAGSVNQLTKIFASDGHPNEVHRPFSLGWGGVVGKQQMTFHNRNFACVHVS